MIYCICLSHCVCVCVPAYVCVCLLLTDSFTALELEPNANSGIQISAAFWRCAPVLSDTAKGSSGMGKTRGQGIKHSRVCMWMCISVHPLCVYVCPLTLSLTQSVLNCDWGSGSRVAPSKRKICHGSYFPWRWLVLKEHGLHVKWLEITFSSYGAVTVKFT